MSEELIKRLRYTEEHGIFTAHDNGMLALPGEAADTIETQAAEIAEYRRQHCSAVEIGRPLLNALEAQAAEIKRLRGIVVNYVGPFDVTPDDEVFVEAVQRAALGETE